MTKEFIPQERDKQLLNKYLIKSPSNKLKFILTDTSFINNKSGRENIGFNKYHNKKSGTKLSFISDINGIPINIALYRGNRFDSRILMHHLTKEYLVDAIKLDQYKKYFLADKGYDSFKIRDKLSDLNFEPIISFNKRASKYNIKKLNSKQNKIYKKRTKIENTFGLIKSFRRIDNRYDHKSENFLGYIYLALICIIVNLKN